MNAELLSIQCQMFAVVARIEAYKVAEYNEQSFTALKMSYLVWQNKLKQ